MNKERAWRQNSPAAFSCDKRPAIGSNGIIVANHPLGAAAGAQILAAGGNAIDAAVASLLTLTVVEPMMVGLIGGGMMHIRTAQGRHVVIDGQSQAPSAATPDMFESVSDDIVRRLETKGRKNAVGPLSTATAGNLPAWSKALEAYGTLSLADVIGPAIHYAEHGFRVSPYLSECVSEAAEDLARDPLIASLFLPDGDPVAAGTLLRQPAYAETLKLIARDGADALHGGALGQSVADFMNKNGGILSLADLREYRPIERLPVSGSYRDVQIIGPPPPASGGVHVIQMLNILEGYDLAAMGYGSTDATHLLAEVMKIAFADRDSSTGDPAFIEVPIEQLTSKAYADQRRAQLSLSLAQSFAAGVVGTSASFRESPHTTHMTSVDRDGAVVVATHTINSLFGGRYIIGETGMIANNYMYLFDPHPGRALSIVPGKRVPTSMAPVIGMRHDVVEFALGVVGGVRIFPSAMQSIVNLVEHGMSLQEAVEAPRVWTQGDVLELESGMAQSVAEELAGRGHAVLPVRHLGGGMNGVRQCKDGEWEGAACWRADGTAIALGGGMARQGVRFWPDQPRK
ncbi:MAG: gamma-glutamyltransferase [Hyphomicrobiaceae bacterium]